MPEINLLQNESSYGTESSDRIFRILSKLLVLVLVLVLAGYAFLFFTSWQSNNSLTKVKAEIQTKQSEIMANEDRNELVTRQAQLGELETLIDKHTYWSYLLPELARVTLRTAQYTAIDAESTGELTLTVTLPSYDDLEKFMQIFDLPEYNEQFSNVRIISINKVQQGTNLVTEVQLELMFNPEYIKARSS